MITSQYSPPPFAALACTCLLVLLTSACNKSEPPEPVDLSQAPQQLESAFSDANAESKSQAQEAAAAIQQQDDPRAFVELQALAGNPKLSDEQRAAAAESLMAVSERLQKAATNGDARAREILDFHRANK